VPILPLESSVFPTQLFTIPSPLPPGERRWRVLHTKPRQEKSIARQLLKQSIPFFLPLAERRSVMRGRVVCSYVPLFPSYLFLFGNREERVAALTTGRIVQSLEVANQEEMWRDLAQVKRLLDSGAAVRPEGRLVPGTSVEISSGPLAGLRGVILTESTKKRFVVQVDFLQQGASVLLDDFYLTPVPAGVETSNDR
jgi:transcription antitermination factor NusG